LRVSIHGGTPIAGWFIIEHPIRMDDLRGTSILGNLQVLRTVLMRSISRLRSRGKPHECWKICKSSSLEHGILAGVWKLALFPRFFRGDEQSKNWFENQTWCMQPSTL
jgi:hypothetical protein